jgi:geranylgeranyl diphosphate synthase type II
MPTVHKKWNDNTAILSGDAMMIKAYEFFFFLKPEILSKVLPVFNKTALQVCEGQQFDMEFETRINVTAEEYLQMITLKTAVLLAASLKIGAIIGGASEKDANLLYDFGINLGIAFQLQDDYLDVYGDVKTFGKQIGGDIVSNKKTYMLISAMEKANYEDKKQLFELINSTDIENSRKIKEVTEIYNQLNIPLILKNKLEYFHNLALINLKQIAVKDESKNILSQLSKELIIREQ